MLLRSSRESSRVSAAVLKSGWIGRACWAPAFALLAVDEFSVGDQVGKLKNTFLGRLTGQGLDVGESD